MSISVLHLIAGLSGGGAEHQLSYLAREQVNRGYRVTIGHLLENSDLPRWQGLESNLFQIKSHGNYDPAIILKTLRLANFVKPDLIHSWILPMDIVAGIVSWRLTIPWIVRESTSIGNYEQGNWSSKCKRWLQTKVIARASGIVSNSNAGHGLWKEIYPNIKQFVVRNALPLNELKAAIPASKCEIGIPAEKDFVIYVGRIEEWPKNIFKLLLAFKKVVSQFDLHIVICGQGGDQKRLEAVIAEEGLSDRVHLKGYVNNIASHLKSARLFCSVSVVEGQPNTVLEAMACGCPLVVSDILPHREFLNEDTAMFVNPTNIDDIAAGIINTLAKPENARRKAYAAQETAMSLSVEKMADAYEQIYQQLINIGSKR